MDNNSADNYSSKSGNLQKVIAKILAETHSRNLWAKIQFNEKVITTKKKLEEYDFEKELKGLKEKLRKLVKTGG